MSLVSERVSRVLRPARHIIP